MAEHLASRGVVMAFHHHMGTVMLNVDSKASPPRAGQPAGRKGTPADPGARGPSTKPENFQMSQVPAMPA